MPWQSSVDKQFKEIRSLSLQLCKNSLQLLYKNMSCPQDLINRFSTMQPQFLHKLTPQQMQQLLTVFHQQLQSKNQHKTHKNKQIRRFRSILSYKRFIRKNMPGIIDNSLSRFREDGRIQKMCAGKMSLKKSNATHKKQSKQENTLDFKGNYGQMLHQANLDELSCPICLQLMVCPTLTACGHAFCYQCLDQSLLFSGNCPNCRQNIKGYQVLICGVLDQLISAAAHRTPQQHFSYIQRVNRFIKWKEQRQIKIQKIFLGMQLDVRDTQSIWCTATVMKIYQKNQVSPPSVLVHYHRWNKLYNQIIEVPSVRLAPFRFFTNRHDIPRYNLSEDDDNLRGTVITGNYVRENMMVILEQGYEDSDDDSSSEQEGSGSEGNQDQQNQEEQQEDFQQQSWQFQSIPMEVQQPQPMQQQPPIFLAPVDSAYSQSYIRNVFLRVDACSEQQRIQNRAERQMVNSGAEAGQSQSQWSQSGREVQSAPQFR